MTFMRGKTTGSARRQESAMSACRHGAKERAPTRRRMSAGGLGLIVLVALFLAPGNANSALAAYSSTLSWDVSMTAAGSPCPNDGDSNIDPGECPNVTTSFQIQPAGGPGGSQSMFDRANVIWTTGPLSGDGSDVTAPQDGLAPKRVNTVGAKVGMVSIQMQSNMFTGTLTQNNVDDVANARDPTVAGQPPRCGADINGDHLADTLSLADSFELWNAVFRQDGKDPIIDYWNTQAPDPNHPYPLGCDPTGKIAGQACAPQGVTYLPRPILALETAMGLTSASRVSRAYGIAKLPIVGGITSNLDVNFLVYSLHNKGTNGYLSVTLIQYPGLPSADPTNANYNPLSQSVQTCPPYWSSATVYGVTSSPDFDEDGVSDLAVTSEINRLVQPQTVTGKSYDYYIETSMAADYDGDGIPAYADRCRTDPASGSATSDSDGDGLSGTCDTNGQNNTPASGSWKSKPPWDDNQDVDHDGILNSVDNCPTAWNPDQKDTDGDSVGDACDPAPTIPGDGHGYASPAPGMFVRYVNICRDPWTVGQPELSGSGDPGRQCLKQDGVITNWQDSNNDGVPDYLDMRSLTPPGPLLADCHSDSDHDGFVDAMEAAPTNVEPCPAFGFAKASDPLDASSPGGGVAVGGIAEPPDEYGSSAAQSGGPPLGVLTIAVLAAGALLFAAGGQYSRKRWRR